MRKSLFSRLPCRRQTAPLLVAASLAGTFSLLLTTYDAHGFTPNVINWEIWGGTVDFASGRFEFTFYSEFDGFGHNTTRTPEVTLSDGSIIAPLVESGIAPWDGGRMKIQVGFGSEDRFGTSLSHDFTKGEMIDDLFLDSDLQNWPRPHPPFIRPDGYVYDGVIRVQVSWDGTLNPQAPFGGGIGHGTATWIIWRIPCADLDRNGICDACDLDPTTDADGDLVPDCVAPCSLPFDQDSDGDGLVDCIDPVDSDGDGFPDDQDPCPSSDTRVTIFVGDTDTGVENDMTSDGCTLSDLIGETLSADPNAADLVQFLLDLKAADAITAREMGQILKAFNNPD